jgi:NosR/NirI family nitrous oxide reductase transcriptional regulator
LTFVKPLCAPTLYASACYNHVPGIMNVPPSLLLSSIAGLLLTFAGTSVAYADAGSYEAPLPVQLSTDPDLCAHAPCGEVIAGAERFSKRMGRPSYVEAYGKVAGQEQLLGYVFLSTDIVDIPAYSGKPVVTLIGMDKQGIVTGVRILKHSEPILLVGIPETELTKFTKQYVGKFVGDKIEIGKSREGEGYIGVDAISGATVTVIAENQVILRCGMDIARQVGILKAQPRPAARFTALQGTRDWKTLLKEGSVRRLSVQPDDVGVADTGEPYIDLYFGNLNAPVIGRSILGDDNHRRLMADLKPGEQAIFVIASGSASFKGSGFVRGGIYDRVQVAQENDTYTFRDTDYLNLYGIQAAGAPQYKESGIFIVRGSNFSSAWPWSFVFLANRVDQETGAKTFINFDREYWLPAAYLEGGRPVVERPDPTWLRVWKVKQRDVLLFGVLLAAAVVIYRSRERLARRADHKDKRWVAWPKYFLWASSFGFVGYYSMAQPSITHVLTWFHSLVYQWKWELFLSDPIIFIFWWFILITIFVWGRGLFCGWLCPYGAMSEIVHKLARALGLRRFQFELPKPLHDKLKWTKYIIFALLLATSFYAMGTAEKMAEVEPFKTTFLVGVWNRSWPFALYWVVLFVAAAFIERPFCKYLCPLGAALAIPSTFRFFGLKRKQECTTCKACAKGCGSLAIDAAGRIDQRECLLCLDCMIMYYDQHACPPLSQERKRRAKAGQPLTPINDAGYFVPLETLQAAIKNTRTA